MAHARYIAPRLAPGEAGCTSIRNWVDAMGRVVDDELKSKEAISAADGHWRKKDIGTDVAVKVEPESEG